MKKIFMAAVLCMTLFIGGTAQADEAGMKAFREAMQSMTQEDTRVFYQDILFFVPTFQSELELIGAVEGDEFKSSGEFNVWATSETGKSTELSVPFYMNQKGKDMKIYFQLDKKWYQFRSPSIAAVVTDSVATPNQEELEVMIDETADATILRETDTQLTMLVNLDGNKIADNIKKQAEENPADNGSYEDKARQDKFFQYLDPALRNSELWYTWTVSKIDGKTMTLAIHLSGLAQEFARAALNDPDQVWDDSLKNIFETLAYYSDVKAYTTFLNSDARKKLEIPKNVLKAKPVESFSEAKK